VTAPSGDRGQNLPSVLFVCVHNAGRSQMAAAFLTHLAGGRLQVRSAGSTPADACGVVVTMGCGDACPFLPGSCTWTGSCRILLARIWQPSG